MDLPRALWPWRQRLSIFPRDLAIALGGVIDKLALLMGPLISPERGGRGEPDGVDGVGRRGSFERLLMSEWALADHAPLEFLRRVSTGELSFLDMAHKKPAVARQCVVLCDVGPDQRGGPRIVQLAAMILLSQRAHDSGASFSWGVVQDASSELVSDVNEESVRKLMNATSDRRANASDMKRFADALEKDAPEVWFVGDPLAASGFAQHATCRIEIEDSFDPDAPLELHVTVVGGRSKPVSARLELPQRNVAVRLLRDPFQVARAVPQNTQVRIAEKSNILISRDFRKLFLRGSEGELITIPIPNSPNVKQLPKPRIFRPPPGETLLAVGRLIGPTIAAVTKDDDGILLHELSTRTSTSSRHTRYVWDRLSDSFEGRALAPCTGGDDYNDRLGTLVQHDNASELLLFDPPHAAYRLREPAICLWCHPVACVCHAGSTLYYVQATSPPIFRWHKSDQQHSLKLDPTADKFLLSPSGYVATRNPPNTWHVWDQSGKLMASRNIPAEYEVLGFMGPNEFAFFALDASRTRILSIDAQKTESCFTSPAPIKTIHATPGCAFIAFLTVEDELCVYVHGYKALVLRMRMGET